MRRSAVSAYRPPYELWLLRLNRLTVAMTVTHRRPVGGQWICRRAVSCWAVGVLCAVLLVCVLLSGWSLWCDAGSVYAGVQSGCVSEDSLCRCRHQSLAFVLLARVRAV